MKPIATWLKAAAALLVAAGVLSTCSESCGPSSPGTMDGEEFSDAHGKVRLWEGGPCWADRNIGADGPWDCGWYFQWGGTTGYRYENGVWRMGDGTTADTPFPVDWTRISFDGGWQAADGTPLAPDAIRASLAGIENPAEQRAMLQAFLAAETSGDEVLALRRDGWIAADGVLTPEHDAARVHWGGEWRLPTLAEVRALIDRCDCTWTTNNGVVGCTVRGRGDYASASIFLPVGGWGFENTLLGDGATGGYWASDLWTANHACGLSLNPGPLSMGWSCDTPRMLGQLIRPVQGKRKPTL